MIGTSSVPSKAIRRGTFPGRWSSLSLDPNHRPVIEEQEVTTALRWLLLYIKVRTVTDEHAAAGGGGPGQGFARSFHVHQVIADTTCRISQCAEVYRTKSNQEQVMSTTSAEALDGLRVPDAQLGGYDAEYIELVRSRMSAELLERYGASHYLWDMLFALVFAGTMVLLMTRLCAGRKRQWLLMVAPVLFAAVDIAENLVLEALMSDPIISIPAVSFASNLTTAKSVLLVLSIIAGLMALLTSPRTPRP